MATRGSGVSRRTFLVAAPLVLTASACFHDSPPTPPQQTPSSGDAAAVRAAIDAELRILAEHDAYVTSLDGVVDPQRAARAMHVAHLRALGGRMATAGGGPSRPPGPRRLRAELLRSATRLRASAAAADEGAVAALLASIGASHAALAGEAPR